ncbi:MAG: hypothetical protein RLZZ15_4165 [Verrucomicrobiota bacterium]
MAAVKTSLITQRHAETGRWVRATRSGPIRVTNRKATPAATVKEAAANGSRPVFPGRDLSTMPRVPVDSTIYISEDRDGR